MPDYWFSVVVPTYNRRGQLRNCLQSLAQQSFDQSRFEVIVVDDGSTDAGAMPREEELPFSFSYVSIPNGGPAEARNAGIRRATGRYVVLLEDDVVADRRFLENAFRHLEDGAVDVLEGRTVSAETHREIRRFEAGDQLSFIPCNLIVRRSAFDAVGGYDPQFYDRKRRLYFREDADLGFRMLDAGLRTRKVADLVVEHPEQFPSFRSCLHHARRYMFDPLLYRKHPRRFRRMIEVKRGWGITVHRPQHYVALLYLLGWLALLSRAVGGRRGDLRPAATVIVLCPLLYRFKYQGWRVIEVHKLPDTLGFFALPFIYLYSVAYGCIRFRSGGALL